MRNRIFTPHNWQQACLLKAREGVLKGLMVMALLLPNFAVLHGQDCISGIVFDDANANGVQDPGENGIVGLTVTAIGPTGTVIDALTNGDGYYEFCMLVSGLHFIFPQLAGPQLVADPPHRSLVYVSGASLLDNHFAVINLDLLGAVVGKAYFDADGNGVQGPDEPDLEKVEITLEDAFGSRTTRTDAEGRFRFDRLPAGDYSVIYEAGLFPNTSWNGPAAIDLVLLPGQTSNEILLGRRPNTGFGAVIGIICYDLNADGVNDPATEPGIYDRVTVGLYDSNNVRLATAETDASGRYVLAGFEPGNYRVQGNYDPEEFNPTTPNSHDVVLPEGFVPAPQLYYLPRRKLFRCGMSAETFFGLTNPSNQVLNVKDIRNRTGAPVGVNQDWAPPSISHPDWNRSRLGDAFGLGIDKRDNLYVAATNLWTNLPNTPGTPLVFRVDPFTGGVSNFVVANTVGINSLPNSGAAIGNICSNPDNDLLYITNREDGTIAVVAAFGNPSYGVGEVVQIFDPAFGGATSGQNLWGIAYNRNEARVYFARDFSDGINPNEIYSVAVNTLTGLITGAETIEFSVPLMGNIDVHLTDIAFSADGNNMLIAERGEWFSHPHNARVFQLNNGVSGTWNTLLLQQIYVGVAGGGANSAGGVDYGYTSFVGNAPLEGECDTYICATGNALILNDPVAGNVYGIAIIPATGNLPGSHANLNSIMIDSDNEVLIQNKGGLGDVEVFDCACPLSSSCDNLGLDLIPTFTDTTDNNCCWSLDYINPNGEAVSSIELVALDGVTLHGITPEPGIIVGPFSPNSAELLPTSAGGLNGSIDNMVSFCLGSITAVPQFLAVNYLGADGEIICTDTLNFFCQPEEPCLYILTDSLVCDTAGYKYTAVVKNPISSNFDVGYVKFNVTSNLPAGATFNPGNTFVLSPPLAPGQSTTIMFTLETNGIDLYGDSLCFVLSAHDDERERLCCAEIDTCIAFPLCDPCDLVDVDVVQFESIPSDSCCYELFMTNQYPDSDYFTGIQTLIVTPGVSFSSINYNPSTGGWIGTQIVGTPDKTSYNWTHNSGFVPFISDYNLFDFCIKGITTTDSVYIAVNWLLGDSIACADTIAVYCPECLEIGEADLECLPDNGGYVYTISNLVNNSPFSVNAVGLVETSPIDTLLNAGVYPVPLTPPGGIIPGPIHVWIAPGLSEACFDIVLRFVDDATGVNFVCCYATHCLELPDCSELGDFLCPDLMGTSTDPCTLEFDPVCGCDGIEYTNACFAKNNGVFVYAPGSCLDPIATPVSNLYLMTSERAGGGADLHWEHSSNEQYDSYFMQRRQPGGIFETIGTVLAIPGQQQQSFTDVNPAQGVNQYQVVGTTTHGTTRYSNQENLFVQWDQSQQINVTAFPVPTQNLLYVASSKQGICVLEILGTDGRAFSTVQLQFEGMPLPVDVGALSEGLFFLRLSYADGETAQQRFVKAR